MNNLEKFERAITFIESNLKEDINLDNIAFEACCSKYHFHRLFKAVIGENIFDYIRKRRLYLASEEILNTQDKITSIAIDYMFESPEAFTRSFKKSFKKTPIEYRRNGIRQIHQGRIQLSLERIKHITQNISVEPNIIYFPETKLVGKKVCVTKDYYQPIIDTWLKILDSKVSDKLPESLNIYEVALYTTNSDGNIKNKLDYDDDSKFYRMVLTPAKDLREIPSDFEEYTIPQGKYAVFTHVGTRYEVVLTTDYIWAVWMMKNDHEVENRPAFEYFGNKYLGPDNPQSKIDLYLPLK